MLTMSTLSQPDHDRHHRVAGFDFDFRKRWPPPLRCMAWFTDGQFSGEQGTASGPSHAFYFGSTRTSKSVSPSGSRLPDHPCGVNT